MNECLLAQFGYVDTTSDAIYNMRGRKDYNAYKRESGRPLVYIKLTGGDVTKANSGVLDRIVIEVRCTGSPETAINPVLVDSFLMTLLRSHVRTSDASVVESEGTGYTIRAFHCTGWSRVAGFKEETLTPHMLGTVVALYMVAYLQMKDSVCHTIRLGWWAWPTTGKHTPTVHSSSSRKQRFQAGTRNMLSLAV